MICRECDTTVAGEMPTLPIERGKPGSGLLAHIMVAKFDDHIPLYRLSEMYDRLGIDISRSVMADWVGPRVRFACAARLGYQGAHRRA